ncbi:ArpU family phage packaging/lysis transcriptional regulator [Parafrankia elaeagni]|uniref:ArpU family phage packaging/lysis transcriptional regulator n=1 Tax=Parafrankia elaeagni TaxID=222534 RepID=UPI000A04668D|nr:ArpU family phage packaging/lysis transcriptional regulator [Parafrankia elaeagni]
MELLKSLSAAEKKKIRKAVEGELERYRIYKTTALVRREVQSTPSYEPRYHGPTNKRSDQTARAAIFNVEEERKREGFCNLIDQAVGSLPEKERFLIEQRYIGKDSEYISDCKLYSFIFDPPISEPTYSKIRNRAIIKLALSLGIIDFNGEVSIT